MIKTHHYRQCGDSGLKLSPLGLGFWHGFGKPDDGAQGLRMTDMALEMGITHFDLANVYGPPVGEAEVFLGRWLKTQGGSTRDRLIIATKAGHAMGDSLYESGGSRKHLVAACEASLKRLGLDWVDIFYHHCPDDTTPLEETAEALAHLVWQGKALYIGLSKYPVESGLALKEMLNGLGVPCVVHQARYNLLQPEAGDHFERYHDAGLSHVIFSPLAQGLLTPRYLEGIPEDSRAAKAHGFLKKSAAQELNKEQIHFMSRVATHVNMTLPQLALAWVLQHDSVASVLLGASRPEQLSENIKVIEMLENKPLSRDVLATLMRGGD